MIIEYHFRLPCGSDAQSRVYYFSGWRGDPNPGGVYQPCTPWVEYAVDVPKNKVQSIVEKWEPIMKKMLGAGMIRVVKKARANRKGVKG